MYWLGSNKTKRDKHISYGLVATVNVLVIGGLQGIMFFALWGKGLPPDNVVWRWIPWNGLFGVWISSMQVTLTAVALSATMLLWARILKRWHGLRAVARNGPVLVLFHRTSFMSSIELALLHSL